LKKEVVELKESKEAFKWSLKWLRRRLYSYEEFYAEFGESVYLTEVI